MKIKTTTKTASFEVGEARTTYKKLAKGEATKITNSRQAYEIFKPLFAEMQDTREEFRVMYLTRNNLVITTELIGIGGATATVVNIQGIFRTAILLNAQGLILAHNHPSGVNTPSEPDRKITLQIKEAAKFFDINLIDHLILGNDYFSFADENLI